MALVTLGTNATNTLNALAWNPQSAVADTAQIAANIKRQPTSGTYQAISEGAFGKIGLLHFPSHRGFICLKPGDYVAYDGAGWPIVVSAFSIANGGGWTHT